MNNQITTTENQTPAELVKQELQKVNITEEQVAAMQKFTELKVEAFINDAGQLIENKEQVAAVRSARLEVKNTRIAIEKKCKYLRDGANDYIKENRKAELQLLGMIEPVEAHLQLEEGKVEALKAELEERERQKASLLLMERAKELQKIKLNNYFGEQFIEIGGRSIACLDLKHNSEEWFQQLLTELKVAEQAEAERKSKEVEMKAAEEAKLAEQKKVQEEENKRLEAIRMQQEAKQKELDAKIEQIAAAERKIAEEARAAAEQIRLAELKKTMEEEARKKAADELDRKQEEERATAARLKAQEEERAKKKAEAEARKEARKPDEKKLLEFAAAIRNLPSPELKTPEAISIAVEVEKRLEEIAKIIATKVAEL
jgi:hypothetical protein